MKRLIRKQTLDPTHATQAVWQQTLTNVQGIIKQKRKAALRQLHGFLQKKLSVGFTKAGIETGNGSHKRCKHILHAFIQQESEDIFGSATKFLAELLAKLAIEIGKVLRAGMTKIASEFENNVTGAWESAMMEVDRAQILGREAHWKATLEEFKAFLSE